MSGVNTNPLNRRWRSGSDVTSSANDVSSGSTTFTVASYNILGDGAIGRNKNYRYVPEHLRFMPSRHPRIMREIEALDPDVVCMQEVQELHYHKVLEPDMMTRGFAGLLFVRQGDHSPAIFYKTGRFELIKHEKVLLSDKIMEYAQALSLDADVESAILARVQLSHNVGLVHVRCRRSGRDLFVGNIHTIWAETKLPTTVTLQVCAAVNALNTFADDPASSMILCGDFNSPPHFPPYALLSTGALNARAQIYCRQEKPLLATETEKGKDLADIMEGYWKNTKPLLKSAYKEILGEEPAITNCDMGDGYLFFGCLDYLWFNPRSLHVRGVLETPVKESILEHVGLPSVVYPSDHISLKAEFMFTSR